MKPGERVRSTNDGQLGHLIQTASGLAVKLDRGSRNEVIVPYRPNTWLADEAPKMGPMQKARIQWEADRAYRISNGEYSVSEWATLSESEKIEFSAEGPVSGVRAELFRAIGKALKDS